jgi:hypothetical protein
MSDDFQTEPTYGAAPPDDGRTVSLAGVRADGWLDRLIEEREGLGQIADVVGRAFVAFGFVAGVRISGLAGDLSAPESTLVDFHVGDDPDEQRLGLNEFRRRLAAALLSDDHLPPTLPEPGDEGGYDDALLQAFLGPQTLLLAPVFGLRLEALVVGDEASPRVVVALDEEPGVDGAGAPESDAPATEPAKAPETPGAPPAPSPGGSARVTLGIEDLRERIRDEIQQEVERVRATSAVSIDLSVLPAAEAALASGDPSRTIALLGAWPGPLMMLLRTPQAASLAPEVRVTLARALGYLGTAYVETGRFDWSEEVLRLGIQFVQEGPGSGDLYRRLGECFAAQERLGEAIGPLRRAVALGVPEPQVLFLLARAYASLGRHVAAAICAERAQQAGVDDPEGVLDEILTRSAEALGEPWRRFQARFASGDRAAGEGEDAGGRNP